ncbi:hypothetical protein APSETT445_008516 [Aspergillus pseudonomiae]
MPPYHEPQADSSPLRLQHHYYYIIIWALLASIILYIPGGLSFVDALLLASGAATQTGLNPIDLKDLHISQQITLWLVPMVTNPVFLHSLLVLIRIYWFRKRFKSAIRDAKAVCHSQRQRMNQALDFEARRPIGLNRTITDTTDTTTTAFDSSDKDDEEQPLLGSTDEEISPGASPPTHTEPQSPVGYQTFKPAAIGPSSPRITFYESDRDYEARQKRRSSFSRRRSFSEAVNEGFPRTDSPSMPFLPSLMWQHSIASYSDWDEDQKEELGGIEYRALKTLGIYDDEDKPNPHGLAAHIQRQLGFDLWYVMLGFFLISVTEGKRIQQTHGRDFAFSLFPLLFEIVSAYGTVGLSLGYPKTETSLSAQFNPVSKLIIIAMQVRGRHRGLPHALDHAILLPCDVHQDQQGEWWWKRWLKRKNFTDDK